MLDLVDDQAFAPIEKELGISTGLVAKQEIIQGEVGLPLREGGPTHQGALPRLSSTRHDHYRQDGLQRLDPCLDQPRKVCCCLHRTHAMGDYHLRQEPSSPCSLASIFAADGGVCSQLLGVPTVQYLHPPRGPPQTKLAMGPVGPDARQADEAVQESFPDDLDQSPEFDPTEPEPIPEDDFDQSAGA